MFRSVYCSSSSYLVVVLAGVFLRFSFALEVVPSSSCTSLCLENPQSPSPPSTFGYEITCDESQYNTTTNGTKFKGCVDCELNSAVVDKATGQTDLGWALCEHPACVMLYSTKAYRQILCGKLVVTDVGSIGAHR